MARRRLAQAQELAQGESVKVEVKPAPKVDPQALVYEPRGAARELFLCRAPEVLLVGAAGTGKSRGLCEKILALANKYPGSRHLLCRKTRASMTESILVTLEKKVIPPGHPILEGPERSHRHSYKLPNGSELIIGGLDKPEATFSSEYDTIALFEAIEATENDWELLHRALRNNKMGYHQAIADTNPGTPTHWLNQRANDGKMVRLLSQHEDNPELWDGQKWTSAGEQYIGILDRLSGHRRQRLRFGKWCTAEGAVYDDFDADVHLIDPFPVPKDWRRIRSIDFGFTNPFVCQWWAVDPDGRMYLYRELYHSRRLVEDHARQILALSWGENISATVSDHDAEDRATLARHGIFTYPAQKAVSLGIEAVSARLKKAGDGKPRLFLMKDCLVERDPYLVEAKKPLCTAQEIEAYSWPTAVDGKPVKEEPVKVDDHGMDSLRYSVMHVDRMSSRPRRAHQVIDVGFAG